MRDIQLVTVELHAVRIHYGTKRFGMGLGVYSCEFTFFLYMYIYI